MINREREIYRVTVIGGLVNAVLLVAKFAAGVLGHSAAMVADAMHSLSDFVSDVVVLAFVRISNKPQDSSHDYGHGKYETVAATIIGVALLVVALGIIWSGVERIVSWWHGEELAAPGMIALWVALLSIALKEITYWYTLRKARQCDSSALEANAWHHRSDALSSVGTTIGIGGAILLGRRWTVLDPIASVIVGVVIAFVAFRIIKCGLDDLTEHSLPDSTEKEILDIVMQYPDVSNPHNLRTRRIGNSFAIELHLRMDGAISLASAHKRASAIERDLRNRFGAATHITLHLEPVKKVEDIFVEKE
ncbi:MAG: cation transporter [Muribaculaceae bacterium]|nr:cation transporter [Muribaculaceae bacterium]